MFVQSLLLFLCFCSHLVTGRRTVLVHHQTGIAAITVTTLGYQVSHLAAAKVPSPVSDNSDMSERFLYFLLKSRSIRTLKYISELNFYKTSV